MKILKFNIKLAFILLITIITFNSCCPNVTQEDLFFFNQKKDTFQNEYLIKNKVYVAKRETDNEYYHLLFYENGIFEYSSLNESLERIINQDVNKRNGLYKVDNNVIYTESYGNCGTSFFYEKYLISENGNLEYLGYTKRITHQLIFGLEPSYKNLSGETMVYELYRDSNNQPIHFELDTNNLNFGDR